MYHLRWCMNLRPVLRPGSRTSQWHLIASSARSPAEKIALRYNECLVSLRFSAAERSNEPLAFRRSVVDVRLNERLAFRGSVVDVRSNERLAFLRSVAHLRHAKFVAGHLSVV